MTSPDQTTRSLERDLDPEAAGALLRRRIRSGDVLERHVRLAAWLGYPPALAAAEPEEPGLAWVGEEFPVQAAIQAAACRRPSLWGPLLAAFQGENENDEPAQARAVAEVLCWGPPS